MSITEGRDRRSYHRCKWAQLGLNREERAAQPALNDAFLFPKIRPSPESADTQKMPIIAPYTWCLYGSHLPCSFRCERPLQQAPAPSPALLTRTESELRLIFPSIPTGLNTVQYQINTSSLVFCVLSILWGRGRHARSFSCFYKS